MGRRVVTSCKLPCVLLVTDALDVHVFEDFVITVIASEDLVDFVIVLVARLLIVSLQVRFEDGALSNLNQHRTAKKENNAHQDLLLLLRQLRQYQAYTSHTHTPPPRSSP